MEGFRLCSRLPKIRFIYDIVPAEDRVGFVAADLHRHVLRDPGADEITTASSAEIVNSFVGRFDSASQRPAALQAFVHVLRKSPMGSPSRWKTSGQSSFSKRRLSVSIRSISRISP